MTEKPLHARVAMVTGASGGIGRALCRHLSAAGADVVLAGRDVATMERVAEELRAQGSRAHVIALDLERPETITSAVAEAERRFGPLDIAISNSGISGSPVPVWDYPSSEWDRVLAINLTGAFHFCGAALRGMVERRRGSVVVIGSIAGKRPSAGRAGYSVSKAGLITLVRTMAIDAGPYGVRANLISPGAVAGGNLEAIIQQNASATGQSADAALAAYRDAAPMRELVQPGDIAAAAVFLASDAAAHITGADLNVTAGLVMH